MGTWEDELDLDLSDIWAAGTSKPVVQVEEEKDDDLAFPSQENRETPRVLGLEAENGNVTRLQTPLLLDADIADAPTQVASQPFVSRGSGSTVPLATQPLPASRGLPPLPTFQPVEHVLQSEIQLPTPNLASREHGQRGSRNPNLREKAPVDIRNYFTHRGSSSGEGASARKKPRIPGPVGNLFRKEQDVVDGDGDGDAAFGEDDFNDRIFRKGAWICALQSLNVAEFDPVARYAILKVTASSIASLRTQQVPHFVAVIKELTPNVFGDAAVILKDPTGTVAGMMNNKVFSNTDYAKAISPGAVIVLKQVALFSPSVHYLNITISNVVQVFPANTDLPSGSAPKQQQRQQEPLPQQPQPQPQRQPQPSPPQLQPQPQRPSPTQPQQPQPQLQPQPQPQLQPQPQRQPQPSLPQLQVQAQRSPPQLQPQPQLQRQLQPSLPQLQLQPQPSPPQLRPQSPSQPLPSPPQEQQGLQPPEAQSQPRPASPPQAAAKLANWDLLSPSPSPSPPQEPKTSEGIAEAAKMAGWGDLADDMEALLNEDVEDFYA